MIKRILPLLLIALPAAAQTPGSNIGLSQYPAPGCTKPQAVDESQKPRPLPERYSDDQAIAYNRQVDAYNARMRAFNEQSTAFGACINTYIAKGNADLRRIQDALNSAAAAANAK